MGWLAYGLKHADWLDSSRVRGYAVLLGLASLGILAAAFFEATGTTGSDFLAFWGAGHVALAGHPAAAYALAVQQQVQTATGSHGWFAFVNPPPFLFLATPFGALPYPLAWAVWVLVGYAIWAWAAIRAFPRLWVLVLVYPGALIAATHAQTGFITGTLLVVAATRLDRRPLAAGAAVGALVIKPHLALLLPFWLAAGRRWTVIFAAGASLIGLLLASWLVFGSATMLGYPDSWQASATLIRTADADFLLRMCSVYAPVRLYFGETVADAAALAVLVACLAVAVLSWRRFRGDSMGSAAITLAATGLASPYLFNYDLPFLIVPTLWLVEQGLRRGFRPYEKIVLIALFLAPYATRAASLPLGLNLMPCACLALIWYAWSRGPEPDTDAGGFTP